MATEDKRIDQLDPVSVLDLTSLMAMQQGTTAKKVTLEQLLDYLNGQIDTGNAVLFVSQTLTESEKRIARKNIRAAGEGDIPYGVVHYLSDQSLTDAQKLQARTNIGAAAPGEGGGSAESAVLYTAQTLTEEQQHQARSNIRCGSVGVSYGCILKKPPIIIDGNNASSVEGYRTEVSGEYGSHAEGYRTKATGAYGAHAEGSQCEAHGGASHSEGVACKSIGQDAHAEGNTTVAEGLHSHSEGVGSYSKAKTSHAEGYWTVAASEAQHVQGRVNIEDADGKYADIVGNGYLEGSIQEGTQVRFPSNAHTLDWDGVPWFAGDRVMLGGTGMDDEAAVALMPVFVPQELTEDQKLQARTNIGAMAKGDTEVKVSSKAYLNSYKIVVTVNGVESEGPAMSLVRYDVNQTGLTEEQKAQARANIGVDAYIEQVFLGGEW